MSGCGRLIPKRILLSHGWLLFQGGSQVVFKFRPGYSLPVAAQKVGERLEDIRDANGGTLTPGAVVDDARPEDSPLHPCFEWNDQVAAELHREDTARRIIRSVEIIRTDRDQEVEQEIAYVSIARPFQSGPSYIATSEAMENPETRDIVLSQAIKGLQAWKRRYGHLKELAEIVSMIGEFSEVVL